MSRFMTRLAGLTSVGHLAFVAALVQLGVAWWLALPIAFASVAMFVNRANVYLRGEKRSRLSVALIDVPYFIHWTAGFLALPIALVALFFSCSAASPRWIPRHAFVVAYVAGAALAAYGAIFRRRAFCIERATIEIPGLDPDLDGYRIAHLSDLHIGPWTPRAWGLRWARAANALECDLAVVTGDLIMSGTAFHDDAADVVGALKAKDGVLVTMGNHDYDHAAGGEALVAAVESRGVRVLRNEGVTYRRGLFVGGIDDRWSNRADLDRVFSLRPSKITTVLLAHDPADFEGAAERGAHLVLSGHTHGGQIAVPFAARHANLGRLHRRHTLGVYRRGTTALVVHPGLGTSGPPVRLGVAPAIVEITLRACGPLSEPRHENQ
jgi:predicted MPP superfamily phosphohydrolase